MVTIAFVLHHIMFRNNFYFQGVTRWLAEGL